ncbi:MAG: enolase C-terminal domain-like protein [Methyloligellaceae bacterium]
MKLDRSELNFFTYVLDQPMGGSGVREVDVLTVEIEDDHGVAGLGFSYVIAGNGSPLVSICEQLLGKIAHGDDIPHPAAFWNNAYKSFNRTGRGWNMLALAAIDVALWDYLAKRQNLPLGNALGGQARQVPVYSSGPFQPGMSAQEAITAAEEVMSKGYSGVKPRLSGQSGDAATLSRIREGLPDKCALMIDVNEKGNLPGVQRLLSCARDCQVEFVEEPLPAKDLGGYRRLAGEFGSLIATGEHLQGLVEFEPYVAGQMAATLQPDLAMIGGLTPVLQLAQICTFHGIGLAPHFLPGLFVHIAAAAPALTWLEEFTLLEPMFDGWTELSPSGTLSFDTTIAGHGLQLSDRARAILNAN